MIVGGRAAIPCACGSRGRVLDRFFSGSLVRIDDGFLLLLLLILRSGGRRAHPDARDLGGILVVDVRMRDALRDNASSSEVSHCDGVRRLRYHGNGNPKQASLDGGRPERLGCSMSGSRSARALSTRYQCRWAKDIIGRRNARPVKDRFGRREGGAAAQLTSRWELNWRSASKSCTNRRVAREGWGGAAARGGWQADEQAGCWSMREPGGRGCWN